MSDTDGLLLAPYTRLKYSWDMILCLDDFITCIGLHKADLKSSRNIAIMQYRRDFFNDTTFNPGGVLSDYIYLEANSFFQYAKLLANKGDKHIPPLPTYLSLLKKFRDEMPAHRDVKEKYKTYEAWLRLQQEMSRAVSRQQIVEDVDTFYRTLVQASGGKL